MLSQAAPSDPLAQRLKWLEKQNSLIKLTMILLLAALLWRGYAAAPQPVEQPPQAAPLATIAAPVDDPPQVREIVEAPSPEATAPTPDMSVDDVPVDDVAAEPVTSDDQLSADQIYRTTQALIEAAYRDPRYTPAFAAAWARRCGKAPSGQFVFPARFDGQRSEPIRHFDGLWDFQLWGAGVHDAATPQAHDCWYMVLWNYDPQTGTASIESLFIGGKEIVHDWRPYQKQRVVVPVAEPQP